MLLGSVFKSVGPYLSGICFSLTSLSENSFPFDYHLMFYVTALSWVVMVFMVIDLPKSLEMPFDESLQENLLGSKDNEQ